MVLLLCDTALLKTMYMLFPWSHTWCPEYKRFNHYFEGHSPGGGGKFTSLYEANGDVPLDGVAFSRLD